LETLYQFQEHCGRPCLTTEHHAPETVATRAARILHEIIIPGSHVSLLCAVYM